MGRIIFFILMIPLLFGALLSQGLDPSSSVTYGGGNPFVGFAWGAVILWSFVWIAKKLGGTNRGIIIACLSAIAITEIACLVFGVTQNVRVKANLIFPDEFKTVSSIFYWARATAITLSLIHVVMIFTKQPKVESRRHSVEPA